MPRPYSYDHFQVPKTLPAQKRSLRGQDKARLARSRPHPEEMESQAGIHYGKSHAQTEEIYQARQMEAELEELARPQPDTKFSHGKPAPTVARGQQRTVPAPMAGSTAPIGALPPTREQPPRGRLPELVEEAGRQLEALQGGLGDAVRAASRLASLPFEVVRLAMRRLLPIHG